MDQEQGTRRLKPMTENAHGLFGIFGTVATFTLAQFNGVLSLLCGLCTLIILAPKAWRTMRPVKNDSDHGP